MKIVKDLSIQEFEELYNKVSAQKNVDKGIYTCQKKYYSVSTCYGFLYLDALTENLKLEKNLA